MTERQMVANQIDMLADIFELGRVLTGHEISISEAERVAHVFLRSRDICTSLSDHFKTEEKKEV